LVIACHLASGGSATLSVTDDSRYGCGDFRIMHR
jgi:hypothetical protein